jgi:hypothetical protein
MSLRGRYQRWQYNRRWKRAERDQTGPLREFVYLDEVSVYSLMASKVGLIVTELTETQATSLQSEVTGSVGGTTGFAKAELGSRVQAGETHGSQVLRKAIIQTTFRQLYDSAGESLALRPFDTTLPTPSVHTLDDVQGIALEDPAQNWVIDPDRLRRGALVEMEVRLEAEPIFHAGTVISGVLDLVQDDPSAFGISDLDELAQVRALSRIVEKLLSGLVPLRGRGFDYEVIELGGAEWLVHRALLDQLAERPSESRPLYLVGVAEQSLFWKDVRRVLFSGSSYRVMARLTHDGVQKTWTPVKLVDVLRDVIPDFADLMDNMNRGVLTAMTTAISGAEGVAETRRVRDAVVMYAALLAERTDTTISEDDLEEAGLLDRPEVSMGLAVREWREVFAPIASYVQERTGEEIDRDFAADCRVAAMTRAHLLLAAQTETSIPPADPATTNDRFLDTEIVAIYW